jgi:RNA polymerase sigma-70 factor (ECF subfamily)
MLKTDEELVTACLGGENSAFDELVGRWNPRIRGAIYRMVGSHEEARDISQETFLKAYRALPGFKGEARFSSWLYQIAMNLCRDRLRRGRGRYTVDLDLVDAEVARQPRPQALDSLVAGDLRRRVAEAVAELSAEHREVLILKEYEGLTFAEIADVTGLPLSTVKTRLYRALGVLRSRLEARGLKSAEAS